MTDNPPLIHHLPLLKCITGNGDITPEELGRRILSGEIDGVEHMNSIYMNIDVLKVQNWTAIFKLLKTGDTTLVHCKGGKDRTGMTAALVLFSLGVNESVVIEDYMLSNKCLADSIEKTIVFIDQTKGAGSGEKLRPLLGVEKGYLISFLSAIKDQYGSIDAFLAELGVDIDAMRENFLE